MFAGFRLEEVLRLGSHSSDLIVLGFRTSVLAVEGDGFGLRICMVQLYNP